MPLLHRSRPRPLAAFVAVAALLLAQAFGLAHGVVHAPGAGLLAQAAHDADDRDRDHDHDDGAFSQHDEGSAECRLIDQAGHGDAAAAPAVAAGLPPAGRAAERIEPPARIVKAGAQPYRARGPPHPLA